MDMRFCSARAGRFVGLVLGTALVAVAHAGILTGFHPLGEGSRANGVSGNGQVIVGRVNDRATRWNGLVLEGLNTFGNGSISTATAASFDGSVVVGNAFNGDNSAPDTVAFRWTLQRGAVALPQAATGGSFENYGARGVSGDGATVVGNRGVANPVAFCYVDPSGYMPMGDPLTFPGSSGNGVSDDGVVAGRSRTDDFDHTEAFRWTQAGGAQLLGVLDGFAGSSASAISADASTIVGASTGDDASEAFLWTQSGGMLGLGDLSGSDLRSAALAVSADGSLVVGYGHAGEDDRRAVLWTGGQILNLGDMLAAEGVDLQGWTLVDATGISRDGLTIVGNGRLGNGDLQGWVVGIPSPAGASLLAIAGLATGARRRRSTSPGRAS
jgi:probable HAF family extracellular repeat protein